MNDFLNQTLFHIKETAITPSGLIAVFGILAITLVLYQRVIKRILTYFSKKGNISDKNQKKLMRIIGVSILVIYLIFIILSFNLDIQLFPESGYLLSLTSILKGILIIQFARLTNHFLARGFDRYNLNDSIGEGAMREADKTHKKAIDQVAKNSVRIAVVLFAAFLLLQNFAADHTLLQFNQGSDRAFDLKISNILIFLLVLLLGRILIWASTQLFLQNYYLKNKINLGTQFAINQLITYFIYVIAIVSAFHFLGIEMTVVWGGIAALLVGVGLGLQQTFNDLFSGILLLFERGIEVGEVVEVDGMIGSVRRIGLRTSIIESRDNVTMIVPNSKLVVNNVINWSHYDDKVRFSVGVGVAYGTDTALVKRILLEIAAEHSFILKYPAPRVRFANFNSSSLDFELLFFSKNFIIIEDIKSELRFEIDRCFREEGITIPFPQTDIWIRK